MKRQNSAAQKDKNVVLKEVDMMQNNKADMNMGYIVVGLILALIVFGFGANLLAKTKNSFEDLAPTFMLNKDQTCMSLGNRYLEQGIEFSDKDNDRRPDACDICISYKNPKATANTKDGDGDGMFSGCDENDNDRSIRKCKKSFNLVEEYRCVEGAPS